MVIHIKPCTFVLILTDLYYYADISTLSLTFRKSPLLFGPLVLKVNLLLLKPLDAPLHVLDLVKH